MIGDILKKTRLIYGYKANEMSKVLGISPSYLSEIENNHKKPTYELLEKYSEVYDIKLSSLILLSENFEDAEKKNKSNDFIRSMMMKLINGMSKGLDDTDETANQSL